MDITETTWSHLQAAADVENRSAPKAVVVALNSILGDADALTSWSRVDFPPESTVWSCWIVTESSVGHVRVEYTHPLYDQYEEGQQEVLPSACAAWVRPLADIVGLQYGRFYGVEGKPTTFEPAESVEVTFSGGQVIRIPEYPILADQRGAADNIFSRLRAGLKF